MKKKILTTSLLLALYATNAISDESITDQKNPNDPKIDEYYNDSERGWFWYEVDGKMVKKKIPPEEMQQPNVIPTEPKQETPTKEIKPEDKELSQAWFRKNFQKYSDRAIENPQDREAMRTYLYLEKMMRERAMEFGYARQAAVYAEPFLDATANRATATFGTKEMNIDATRRGQDLLTQIGAKSGLFFFYRSDSPYCTKEAPLIKALETRYGFSVRPVSLDGAALPDSPWESYLVNVDQAEKLGVIKVPAVYLFNPATEKYTLVAQGLQSFSQLEKRILYAANEAEIINDDELKLIRPSGLYPDINGNVGTPIAAPADAPEEFKELFNASLKYKNSNNNEQENAQEFQYEN